ncbi:hypothetical protein PoB_000252700 [Plakobranchus ocellatus]|uniref:Uncharacterized protein n=1 Tax=Plakobranchus ocellatus TaxID=259542 RepID=A0AAV3XZT4_9GAST|nr:hypothetical protein PoB_000252700 [Plakobranchus ocellatus]
MSSTITPSRHGNAIPLDDSVELTLTPSSESKFLQCKDSGGLKLPSKGVVDILQASEKAFRIIMPSPALMDILPSDRFVDLHIQTMVLSSLQSRQRDLFPTIIDHFYDHEVGIETDHISKLIKTVAR